MQELSDAIKRLNDALNEYEARQRAKELVSLVLSMISQIPGFPPVPNRTWEESESELHGAVDGMGYSELLDWGAICATYPIPGGG